VKPGKVHVMPNGVNPDLFRPRVGERGFRSAAASHTARREKSSATVRAGGRSGLKLAHPEQDPRGPVLGFVGGLRPWHGVEVLPALLARLAERRPTVRLVIAGDGPLRGQLEREFKQRRLAKRVVFKGTVSHEEIPAVIRQFDIALAPYPKHDHAFYFSPLKLFEYMACGAPVVAANVGQISKVVGDGTTGLLYPAGNLRELIVRCERLLSNPQLCESIGRAAAKLVRRKFTWANNAARVVKLARNLKRTTRRARQAWRGQDN